eukprot:176855-Pyramimonas_sp.AAC.1
MSVAPSGRASHPAATAGTMTVGGVRTPTAVRCLAGRSGWAGKARSLDCLWPLSQNGRGDM